MRTSRRASILLIVAVGAICAPTAYGQEPAQIDSATAEAIRDRAEEFARAWLHVDTLLGRVFDENPALKERLDELAAAYLDVMAELDPETARRRARFRELETAYTDAVMADDGARVQAVLREGADLRRALEATAAEAGRRQDLSRRVESLRTEVVAGVSQIDPAAVRFLAEQEVVEGLIMDSVVGFR